MKTFLRTCKSGLFLLSIGLFGALFCLTPWGATLEEEFGLSWLFKTRGSIAPPENIVIISIDKFSTEVLRLPEDPEKWPRSYYAELIAKINQQHPALLAINITFNENRSVENDLLLANAMTQNNNIILSNYIKRNVIPSTNPLHSFSYERIINPIPIFQQAAFDTAPFPLPKTASTVNQFWIHKKSAGGIATFPGSIFQYYVFDQFYPEIVQLLYQLNLPLDLSENIPSNPYKQGKTYNINSIQQLQKIISNNDKIREQLFHLLKQSDFSTPAKKLINSWLTFLDGSNSFFFNHYGKAKTITTIPFYQALSSDISNPKFFNNKIVLLGYSEDIEPEKNQGLYTVFSTEFGEITSPIEIAATAVANLVSHNWIQPLDSQQQFFLILAWGIFLSIIHRIFTYRLAMSLIVILSLAYVLIAYQQFLQAFLWIPVIIPILLQMPLVLVLASLSNYRKRKREHQNMHQAFSLYLPDDVVNHAAYQQDINAISNFGELMQGVCMATDAGQYTTLSETMNPLRLSDLMNAYYGVMFPKVKQYKGIISDVIGDAMLAIWAQPKTSAQTRINACHAALTIINSVHQFNNSQPHQLPTRIGLHFGEMRLGNVGAADHYEYRAIGDTVNTATRIEGLNKILGTEILVSAEVIQELPNFNHRELGYFILKGKTQAIHIYQLLPDISDQTNSVLPHVYTEFSNALKFFQQQQWAKALEIWNNIEKNSTGDGPTRFYISFLKQNLHLSSLQFDKHQISIIKIGNFTNPLAFKDEISIE